MLAVEQVENQPRLYDNLLKKIKTNEDAHTYTHIYTCTYTYTHIYTYVNIYLFPTIQLYIVKRQNYKDS